MACNCSGACRLTGGCGLGVGRVAFVHGYPQRLVPSSPRPSGWECPKCGRIYGPRVVECYACNKKEES